MADVKIGSAADSIGELVYALKEFGEKKQPLDFAAVQLMDELVEVLGRYGIESAAVARHAEQRQVTVIAPDGDPALIMITVVRSGVKIEASMYWLEQRRSEATGLPRYTVEFDYRASEKCAVGKLEPRQLDGSQRYRPAVDELAEGFATFVREGLVKKKS